MEGPPLGPGGEDITWPDQVAPRGRKASSTRKIKPQTSNLQRTWDDCRATSERKSRTHSYDELVDLLIELALERENDSHMEKFLKKHFGRGGTPTPERGEGKGPKNPTNTNQGGGKGRGNLRAMNEVKHDAGTPPLFYCKPVNDKGGPCHASDCDHRISCMLQMKR